MRKVGHWLIAGVIELKSGTRIGGSDDVLQIGGTDLTCIKDPVTDRPYIPGSSLKGKMRSELEKHLGKFGGNDNNEPCGCAQEDCPVCRVFGPHQKSDHRLGPTRIIVRDAPLLEGGDIELKTESTIKRSTGGAQHPRTLERVAAGSRFRLEIGVQELDLDAPMTYEDHEGRRVTGGEALVQIVYHCLDLIEASGLGSGTSKGYGAVEITVKEAKRLPGRRERPQPTAGSGA
ncbi:MAG: type III-A CRISPR-associated RAMP protein Csm3 [Gemmatimonadetes bacterium]|nr:type III-A CRISPR-associated RAMP protein Csm3 [Gemmatimonadota bacterium]